MCAIVKFIPVHLLAYNYEGEFDSMDSSGTKLQHLLEQRVIGNKEFHPLSGHALLGFRLLPGPVS